MCNLYTQTRAVEAVRQAVRALQMPIRFPEGIPNLSPRDICITGYDDLLTPYINANLHLDGEALPWSLPITTVRQPLTRIGATAAQVLIQQIEGKSESDKLEHLLDVELVTGTTSIPPALLLAAT